METALERFGENVRKARLARKWTQEELSRESGLGVVHISRVERGVRDVRLTTLLRLMKALEVPPEKLLDGLH